MNYNFCNNGQSEDVTSSVSAADSWTKALPVSLQSLTYGVWSTLTKKKKRIIMSGIDAGAVINSDTKSFEKI